jgi:electron transport complex protein RnfG
MSAPSTRLVATLGLISVISGVLVAMTSQLTLPRIERNKREALEKAIFQVLPGATSRGNFRVDETGLHRLDDADIAGSNVFAGYNGAGDLVGYALEASARGYQDVVRILYGYVPQTQCIIGFVVLQSTETPGLGDRVTSDPGFLANFTCLEAVVEPAATVMRNEIVTVKNGKKTQPWQIDGISGATVTSTAIGRGLRESSNRLLPLLAKFHPKASTP